MGNILRLVTSIHHKVVVDLREDILIYSMIKPDDDGFPLEYMQHAFATQDYTGVAYTTTPIEDGPQWIIMEYIDAVANNFYKVFHDISGEPTHVVCLENVQSF